MNVLRMKNLTRLRMVASTAAILAACGGGDDNNGSSTIGTTSTPSGTTATPAGTSSTATSADVQTAATTQLLNTYAAKLSGAQVSPANASTATGAGAVVVNATTRQFTATLVTNGITGTEATIRSGAPGTNGEVVFNLTQVASGTGTTGTSTTGTGTTGTTGTGTTGTTSTGTTGTGTTGTTSTGTTGTGTTGTTGTGTTGTTTTTSTSTTTGSVWTVSTTLTQEQYDAFKTASADGTLYFNVASAAFSGGEIRGQILPSQQTVATTSAGTGATTFVAALRGAQEVPPVNSQGEGSAAILVDPATMNMVAAVTTIGITGNAAHIHIGAPSQAGAVVIPLVESSAGSGVWTVRQTLTTEQLTAMRSGNYYVNVHTVANPNGEIRGQIFPVQFPTATGTTGSFIVGNGIAAATGTTGTGTTTSTTTGTGTTRTTTNGTGTTTGTG